MDYNNVLIVDERRPREEYIRKQVKYQTELEIDDPLVVVDIDEVVERYRKWNKLLPRVELFYALKCNNDEKIAKVLAKLGSSFDCASKEEIQQILELGVDPSRIIYANPCKQNSHLSYAKEHNVDLMTFDSEEELIKIKMLYGTARLLLRFRSSHAYKVTYDLGKKFGCTIEEATDLLISAKEKGLNVIGVSFHVGSECLSVDAFSTSIKEARMIFDMGLQVGCAMEILDIGGGFRGREVDRPTIEENADIINQSLDEYFPETNGVKIIAEPGRFLVETAVSAGVIIIGRKFVYNHDKTNTEHVMYNINDGVYGSFNWVKEITDGFCTSPVSKKLRTEKHASTIWGPTCCCMDCLAINIQLPLMEVGEWMNVSFAGAYSFCLSTSFNNMPPPRTYYFCSHDTWFTQLGMTMQSR
ncbi:ornithine decarboxylase-like [Ylistrum balloti]|uniref:ornithine decarboxylase-like n=1 Tax=Ylistrum balloti TaxID=509963 RepID=UPI002905CEBA|nr:ornithine decarboxylase-like [Ylistrum balloti]